MPESILAQSFLPFAAVFEMTYKCNHKCLFCSCPWEAPDSNYQKDKELTIEEWKECASKLCDMGVSNFSYTGGEPLMKEGIFELIEYIASLKAKHINKDLEIIEKAPDQYLITNGQLLKDEHLDFIKKHDISLSLSLPGLRTYNQHTQNGHPERILELFQKTKEKGIKTTVNIATTKLNLHELYETISNALIAGADNLLINRFLPGGRGLRNVEKLLLNKEETLQMINVSEEVLVKANRTGSVGTELPLCILDGKKYEKLSVGSQCSGGTDFFVIGPEGRVRTCNHSAIQLQHYKDIEELKNDNYWKRFVFRDYQPEMCDKCELLHQCDGGCREAAHIYTGLLDGNDPLF